MKIEYADLNKKTQELLLKALKSPQDENFDNIIKEAIKVQKCKPKDLQKFRNAVVRFLDNTRNQNPSIDYINYWDVVWMTTGLIDAKIVRNGGQV